MTHAHALFRRLTDSLSGAAADELHEAILSGQHEQALGLIRREGFSTADSQELLQLCIERWSGGDVELTEVPLADVAATIARQELRHGASGGEAAPYLVRHGRYLMPARAMRQGSSYELWGAAGVVPLARIRQFWLVSPKTPDDPAA
jgi:hypothetical protein